MSHKIILLATVAFILIFATVGAIPLRPRGNIEGDVNISGAMQKIYNISGFFLIKGNKTWEHNAYPVACPTGYSITRLGDSVTCTINRDPQALNLTVQVGNYTDIQAKLRKCPSDLYIPAGTYTGSVASLNITCGNITIHGDGRKTIILRTPTASAIFRPTMSYTTIRDLAMDCLGQQSAIAAVQYSNVDYITIDNVDIRNTNGTAVFLGTSTCSGSACIDTRNSNFCNVQNSRLINVQNGIAMFGKGGRILGNTIIGTANKTKGDTTAGKWYGEGIDTNVRGWEGNSTATIIMGNYIANFSQENIDCNGGWSTITGNVIDGTPFKHADSTRCVEIGDAYMVTFSGNTVRNCMNMSLRLSTIYGGSIVGNTFSGPSSGIGISMENSDYTTITGNAFKNLSVGIVAQTKGNDNDVIDANSFSSSVLTKASLNTTDTDNIYQIEKAYYYKGNFSRNVTAPYFVGTATTAADLTCTDCISATEITDVYVLNAGDTVGALTLGGTLIRSRVQTLTMTKNGNITINGAFNGVDTNGSAIQDLNCLLGGTEGQDVILKQAGADARDIRFRNLNCGSTANRIMTANGAGIPTNDFNLTSTKGTAHCFYTGSNGWVCQPIYTG